MLNERSFIHLIGLARLALLSGLLLALSACAGEPTPGIVQISEGPASDAPRENIFDDRGVVYVTPTPIPTMIPTFNAATATPSPTATASPTVTPRPTSLAEGQAFCEDVRTRLYDRASDACLGGPDGYFCNGGLAPGAEPAGPVQSALGTLGALVEVNNVTRLHTPPMMRDNAGGLVWMRLDERVRLHALLVGDVNVSDVTPTQDAALAPWSVMLVETRHAPTPCEAMPNSSLILQSPYGQASRFALNGVSVDLTGTLAVQTHDTSTHFILLEGQSRLSVLGQAINLFAGQQAVVDYAGGNFSAPTGVTPQAVGLTWEHIAHLPVALLDRPVLLPQPGYAATEGVVNLRARPDLNGRLLYRVPAGEILTILGQNEAGDWYHIRLGNGETGWMSAPLLRKYGANVQLSYSATPVPPQRFGDLGNKAIVSVAAGGNLRQAPDTAFPVLATLPYGTEVELLGRSSYSPWVKVDANGQIGWMALLTIDTNSAVAFLPVDYDAPLPPRPTAAPVFEFGGGHAYPDPRGW